MIGSRVKNPNILIVSGMNKRASRVIGKNCSEMGARVMIADLDMKDCRVIIEYLNEKGKKYASITREVKDEQEAMAVFHYYLNDCEKFDMVINLDGEDSNEFGALCDMLVPDGGILYSSMV